MGIVIVGAGLAGLRTADECRRKGYTGSITLIGAERHLPYDRPPLSKQVVCGEISDTTLQPASHYAEHDIELRLGVAASGLDPVNRVVRLADGSGLEYESLVIATGLTPRRLPGLPAGGVHVLRSIDDCRAIRADLEGVRRVLVIGGGFIGCELAASMRGLGLEVILIEMAPGLLAAPLGAEVGRLVTRLHKSEGVDVRTGVGLVSAGGVDRVRSVTLSDGTEMTVDMILLGVGSTPATEWLDGSGVVLDNGVPTDGTGRTNVPDVWAVGDVAAWRRGGRHRRVEHWSNVGEQVSTLVPAMLGLSPGDAVAAVPYFWSDQYKVKLQALGTPRAGDTVHIVEDDGRRFLAYYERDGSLAAVVGAGMAGKVMRCRAAVAAGVPIGELLPGGG